MEFAYLCDQYFKDKQYLLDIGDRETYEAYSFQACPYDLGNPGWYGKDRNSYKAWGSNSKVEVKLNDFETAEEYWEAVRKNAAKNLDELCNRH